MIDFINTVYRQGGLFKHALFETSFSSVYRDGNCIKLGPDITIAIINENLCTVNLAEKALKDVSTLTMCLELSNVFRNQYAGNTYIPNSLDNSSVLVGHRFLNLKRDICVIVEMIKISTDTIQIFTKYI